VIVAPDVARHIGVIAHDSMMGRMTGQSGLEMAARYVADQFQTLGLKPGGENGTWFQRYRAAVIDGDTVKAANTVGIIEGSDPKLKDEYIVISAHMDHIGTGQGRGFEHLRGGAKQPADDSIYNGADDNASGTAGIIALAKAFSQPGVRPRRSVIFLGVGGEEGGFLGSRHFVQHPPVPFEQLVANINMDMIGRVQGDTIFIKGGHYSDLATLAGRVVAAHPELRLAAILRTDATRGSDHAVFARKRIPILFFYDGGADHLPHPDYHRATDSPEKINTDAAVRVLRLVFYVAREIGVMDQRPQWNEVTYREQNPGP
jgi:Zn-dependent M28 family amino/carboxypeptidase